jgi:hypothetical protein
MPTAPSPRATTTAPVPIGTVIELLVSDLTRDEFEALFGADEEETQRAELDA